MTHDDLDDLAQRPVFNRYQRGTLQEIAQDLRAEATRTKGELDAAEAHFASLDQDPSACRQLVEDYGALLTRARNAYAAEAYPRALAYLVAMTALLEEQPLQNTPATAE